MSDKKYIRKPTCKVGMKNSKKPSQTTAPEPVIKKEDRMKIKGRLLSFGIGSVYTKSSERCLVNNNEQAIIETSLEELAKQLSTRDYHELITLTAKRIFEEPEKKECRCNNIKRPSIDIAQGLCSFCGKPIPEQGKIEELDYLVYEKDGSMPLTKLVNYVNYLRDAIQR